MKTMLRVTTVECAGLAATGYIADTKENLDEVIKNFKEWNEPNGMLWVERVKVGLFKNKVLETVIVLENE